MLYNILLLVCPQVYGFIPYDAIKEQWRLSAVQYVNLATNRDPSGLGMRVWLQACVSWASACRPVCVSQNGIYWFVCQFRTCSLIQGFDPIILGQRWLVLPTHSVSLSRSSLANAKYCRHFPSLWLALALFVTCRWRKKRGTVARIMFVWTINQITITNHRDFYPFRWASVPSFI